MVNVTLAPRNSTISVDSQSFTVGEEKSFLEHPLLKEVIDLPRKKQKKALKILATTFATAIGFIMMTDPTWAAVSASTTEAAQMTSDLTEILKDIELIALLIGLAAAKVCMILAAFYKLFRKHNEAKAWTVDIIKAVGQILAGPVVIMMIALTFHFLFSGYSWYVSPF